MGTCKTCKHWLIPEEDEGYGDMLISPRDPVTYEQEENEEAIAAKWGYNVRFCKHPKLETRQRPDQNGFAVIDASDYYAGLLTGEDFGCVLHSANSQ